MEVRKYCKCWKEYRKFLTVGNWKMNVRRSKILSLCAILSAPNPDVQLVMAVPSIYIEHTKKHIPKGIELCAQNCYKLARGPFTGETSPQMLLDAGVKWVMVGQAERRDIFNEKDDLIAEKTAYALEAGLNVICCCCDKIEDRENGLTEVVCFRQLQKLAELIEDWDRLAFAYEPTWTFENKEMLSQDEVEEICRNLRAWLADHVCADVARVTRIIYGGLMDGPLARKIAKKRNVDGFLLNQESFDNRFVVFGNAVSSG